MGHAVCSRESWTLGCLIEVSLTVVTDKRAKLYLGSRKQRIEAEVLNVACPLSQSPNIVFSPGLVTRKFVHAILVAPHYRGLQAPSNHHDLSADRTS